MAAPSGRRKLASAAATVLGAGLILSTSATGVSARPVVDLQTPEAAPPGATATPVGDTLGAHASISGDGKFVVYQGLPPGATVETVEGETDAEVPADPRNTTIYLTNREDGATVELTAVPAGLRHGDSVRPVISGDGCSVVAITEMALDVFRDDDGGDRWDVYRSVLPHCGGEIGNWELVSTRNDGFGLARDDVRPDQTPAVSRSGAEVAYVHPDDRLFDAPGVNTVTLVDLTVPVADPARSVVVTGMPNDRPNTTFVHVGIDQPAISDDARYVAYRSDAVSSAAVPTWGTGLVDGARATQQVFVWDRQDADPFTAVRLVSALPSGEPSRIGASEPALSRDGRVVAFTSAEPDFVDAVFPPCTDECPTQIYRFDRDVDENGIFDEVDGTALELVSADPDSATLTAGIGASFQPTLSADGHLLAFVSKATNLQLIQAPGGGEATDGDVLVAVANRPGLRRVTVSSDGVRPTIGAHSRPQLSDTGRVTVFDTLAASQLLDAGAPPGRQVVSLSSPPRLSLADADVGTTLVGVESAGWFVGLVNDGPSGFQPAEVTISDSRFELDPENSTCLVGTLVPAGSRCNVAFTFTPTSSAAVNATLTVSEVGFGGVSVQSKLSGTGGEPALQISPGGADLGAVDVGETATEFLFDVSNIGFLPTRIDRIVIAGAHPDDFALSSNNCDNRPLNPRASCAVGVLFTPSDSGRRTALVEVFTPQGQSTSVILAGDGEFAPELATFVTEVEAGREFILGGVDYPPNEELTVVFGDGPTDTVKVTTDATGGFVAIIPVATNERGGERKIVVQSPRGAAATAPIEVIEDTQQYVGLPGFGLGG